MSHCPHTSSLDTHASVHCIGSSDAYTTTKESLYCQLQSIAPNGRKLQPINLHLHGLNVLYRVHVLFDVVCKAYDSTLKTYVNGQSEQRD